MCDAPGSDDDDDDDNNNNFNICKETRVQLDKKHWYEHVPKSVEQAREAT